MKQALSDHKHVEAQIRARKVRELTRSFRSKFEMICSSAVQVTCHRFVWKVRSVHLMWATNFKTFSKFSSKFTQFSSVRRSVQ